ncbi:MAG: YciI family protein [Limisphaerales bacterium]
MRGSVRGKLEAKQTSFQRSTHTNTLMKSTPTNQYMFLVQGGACNDGVLSAEQMQAKMTEVYAWIDGLTKKGVMSAAQPLTPERKIVSGKNGNMVSDGIAAESKEAIGGFFIVNVATMDEAVNIAQTCPMFKYGGRLEVRQIAELKCD